MVYDDDYGFILRWEELDLELREQKIDDYILFHYGSEDVRGKEARKLVEDENLRAEARIAIRARFPIYF